MTKGNAGRPLVHMSALGHYVDGLIQTFEDCRSGLSDASARAGGSAAEAYFLGLYDREAPRLVETVRAQEPHLSDPAQDAFRGEVDALIRKVIIPAYVRLCSPFTVKERNDFYLTSDKLHGLERAGWGLAGILIGLFVIWAPFIPLWSKEWILPFMIAGLFFPNFRRFLSLRKYEGELNRLVARADRELGRLDAAYLASGEVIQELEDLGRDKTEEALRAKIAALSGRREKER